MPHKPSRRELLAGWVPLLSRGAPSERKYLVLDSRAVERVEGAALVIGTAVKDLRNPLFREDKPWEPRFDNLYPNVLFEERERLFKCWYSPFIVDEVASATPPEGRTGKYTPGKREMGVCYATSSDGVRWTKPSLGIVEFSGSKANNLVARGPHGAGVFKDLRDPDPARRYKMFFKGRSMAALFSPDGLHWSGQAEFPEIQAPGDTHNNAFWAPEFNRYVGITRLKARGERLVGRTESPDFLHWTRAVEVFRSLPEEGARRQVYAMPVFRYANVYLGLAMVFDTQVDNVDCELAWSPDTLHWERICPGTPLIPRGPEGSCDCGCIYAAAYPVIRAKEILLYYGGNDGPHFGWRKGYFCLARLRPDGFAGYRAAGTGTLVSKPLRWEGSGLRISADASRGQIRAGILDADGFSIDRGRPVRGDVTGASVTWRGSDLRRLAGREVRLAFELRSATLYSFSFAD